MVAISKSDITLTHFGCETALKNTFAFVSFQRIDLQQQFEYEVLVHEGLPVFHFLLCPQDTLYLLYYIVLIWCELLADHF